MKEAILCMVIGYLIGGINAPYLAGILQGIDIRKKGSGNAGATNAFLVLGKKAGILSALFDIFKAFFSIKLAVFLFRNFAYAGEVAGVSCILGHMFPVFMEFRGGKGLACLGGSVLAFNLKVFLVMLLICAALAVAFDYIVVVPVAASIAFPAVYTVMTGKTWGAAIMLIATAAILYKHMENFGRIREGKELRLSYLWNKDAELERIQYKEGQ